MSLLNFEDDRFRKLFQSLLLPVFSYRHNDKLEGSKEWERGTIIRKGAFEGRVISSREDMSLDFYQGNDTDEFNEEEIELFIKANQEYADADSESPRPHDESESEGGQELIATTKSESDDDLNDINGIIGISEDTSSSLNDNDGTESTNHDVECENNYDGNETIWAHKDPRDYYNNIINKSLIQQFRRKQREEPFSHYWYESIQWYDLFECQDK